MSEAKVVISCEVLKRITPLLEESISYEPVMFIDVFREMEAIFLVGKITDDPEKLKEGIPYYMTEEQMNYYLRKRKPEDFTPKSKYNPLDPFSLIYEFGNNIEFTIMSYDDKPPFPITDFNKLWDSYKLPHDDYYYAFLILIAVYAKYIYTAGMFEAEVWIPDEYRIWIEELKLYEFLHKNTSPKNTSLKITVNGVSLKLDNINNWLKKVVNHSLGKQMDIQAVRQELAENCRPKNKKGRKTKPELCNVLLSAYNLIHKTDLMTNKVILSDKEAYFIMDFFQYLQLDAFKKANTEYVRAILAYYQQKKSPIKWWAFE